MKHFPFHLLLLAAAITLASCSGDTPGEDTLPAIGFTTQTTDTRAVVESPADMTAFQVWGWYGTTASLTNVFNGDEVRHTGNAWTYDVPRYWIPGQTYNFYALHPYGLNGATCKDDGTLTITDFTCGAGDNATDLMTARATGLNGSDAPVVNLTFSHELVRITVDIKSDITTEFKQLRLINVPSAATFTKAADGTTAWSNLTYHTPFLPTPGTSHNISAGGEFTNVFGTLLVIPKPDVNAKPQLHLVYQDEKAGTYQTKDIELPDADQWAAGQSYRYTCTITGAQSQLKIYYTVTDWTGKEINVPDFK